MRLRERIPLLVGLSLFLWIGAIVIVSQFFVLGGFRRLESEDARTNVLRASREIDTAVDKLFSTAGDWAFWDDTYRFAQDSNREFSEDNLRPETAVNLELSFMVIVDAQDRPVNALFVDLQTGERLAVPERSLARLTALKPRAGGLTEGSAGILLLPEAPALVACRRILHSDRSGPPQGRLLLGRYLDSRELKRMQDKLELPLSLLPPDALPASAAGPDGPQRIVVEPLPEGRLAGYTVWPDLEGGQAFTLRVLLPRKIYRQGLATLLYFYGALAGLGALFLALLVFVLSRALLAPLSRMSRSIEGLPADGEPGPIGFPPRADELGVLGRAIDGMLAQIKENRKKLLEQAYALGKAEMASEVLHSVRNALTPLVGELELLAAAPEAGGGSSAPLQDWRDRLRGISSRTAKIEEILDAHERWAYGRKTGEPVRLGELLQDAFLVLDDGHRRLLDLEWLADPGELTLLTSNRIALLQVFANLLRNAAESIQRQGLARGTVQLSLQRPAAGPERRVEVSLRDNGAGIRPEHLERLFARGFTTKTQPASGLGLHWCANTLQAMRGGIAAESAGPGRGACFRVSLPLREES